MSDSLESLKAENEELKKQKCEHDWRFNGDIKYCAKCTKGELNYDTKTLKLDFSKDRQIENLQQENNQLKEEKEQFLALIVKIQSENEELKQLKQRAKELHFIDVQIMFPEIISKVQNRLELSSLEETLLKLVYNDYQKLQQLLKDYTV